MAKAYADPLKTRGILQSSVWGGQVLQVSVRDGRPNRRNKFVEKKAVLPNFSSAAKTQPEHSSNVIKRHSRTFYPTPFWKAD